MTCTWQGTTLATDQGPTGWKAGLLNTGETTSGEMCPLLGSTGQETHGHTGVSQAKGS